MKRREAIIARQEDRRPRVLGEIDYLLGVHDLYRQGALRFKKNLMVHFLMMTSAWLLHRFLP